MQLHRNEALNILQQCLIVFLPLSNNKSQNSFQWKKFFNKSAENIVNSLKYGYVRIGYNVSIKQWIYELALRRHVKNAHITALASQRSMKCRVKLNFMPTKLATESYFLLKAESSSFQFKAQDSTFVCIFLYGKCARYARLTAVGTLACMTGTKRGEGRIRARSVLVGYAHPSRSRFLETPENFSGPVIIFSSLLICQLMVIIGSKLAICFTKL